MINVNEKHSAGNLESNEKVAPKIRYKEFGVAAGTLFLFTVIDRLGSLIFRYILAINMDPVAFGNIALNISLFLAIRPISTLELAPILAWRIRNKQDINDKFGNIIITLLTSGLLATIVGLFLGISNIQPNINIVYAGIICFITCISVNASIMTEGIYRGQLLFIYSGIAIISLSIGRLILLLVLGSVSNYTSAYFYAFYLGPVLSIIIFIFAFRSNIKIKSIHKSKIKIAFPRRVSFELLWYSAPLSLASWARGMYLYGLRYIALPNIKAYLDLALVGYQCWSIAITTAMSSLLPLLSRNRKFDIKNLVVCVFAVATSSALLVAFFSDKIIIVLKYLKLEAYSECLSFLVIIILAAPFDLLANYESTALQAKGKHWLVGVSIPIANGISYVIAICLSNYYPYIGLAISFPLSSLITYLLLVLIKFHFLDNNV